MKKIINHLVVLILILIIITLVINLYVILSTKNKIYNIDEINYSNIDCIIVLGAGIRGTNPSPMLEDRLLTGIDLYNKNVANKIIVSGDHGRVNYDEVNVMKKYLIENGIPSENIFMDHAGFSTYDSVYRAKEVFEVNKAIIVTQEYHLYRALYIAKGLKLDAYGVIANRREYKFQQKRDIREIAARIKDFIKTIFKPEPKYLGETISVSGNGNITNDK